MKRYIVFVIILLIVAIVSFLVVINNKNKSELQSKSELDNTEKEVKWVKVPTAYVNNQIYVGRGEVLYSIPEGWEYYGAILKNVSRVEFTPEEELNSNVAKVGAKVFLNRNNLGKIYIEFIIDGKTQYNGFRAE